MSSFTGDNNMDSPDAPDNMKAVQLIFRKHELLTYLYDFFAKKGHPERFLLFHEYLRVISKDIWFVKEIETTINKQCFYRLSKIPISICNSNSTEDDINEYLLGVNIPCLVDSILIDYLLPFFKDSI